MRLQRDRAAFVTWWAAVSRPKRALSVFVMVLLASAAFFALAVMGPRLVREGWLLWFGTYAEGLVLDVAVVRSGAFKYGEPKYQATFTYGFQTPDGKRFTGTTLRGDLRDPPALETGAPIGVHYAASAPVNSVADYNLRTDVYALALFLPFLVVMGLVFPAWFMLGVMQWSRQHRDKRADAVSSP